MTNKLFSVEDIPRRRFLELGIKGGIALAAAPSLMSCLKKAGEAPPAAKFPLADLNKVIQRALSKGGEFGEVYIENRISRSILLEEGKFKSAVFGISRGAGVRVISGDKTGYAYTDDLTRRPFLRAADVASYVARGAQGRRAGRHQGREAAVLRHRQGPAPDRGRREAPRDHEAGPRSGPGLRSPGQDGLDRLLRRGPRPGPSPTARASTSRTSCRSSSSSSRPWRTGNGTSHMGRERLSRHAGIEMFDDLKPEDAARTCAREAVTMLEAKDAPAGKMDVVMQNGWGGVLVHEAVGHPLEGDNIARETGVFVGKLGQTVAGPKFTMVDDGTLPCFRGTTNYDDEGTPMKRNVLIQEGMLVKYMTDILSAKQIRHGAHRATAAASPSATCPSSA